jgi:transposase
MGLYPAAAPSASQTGASLPVDRRGYPSDLTDYEWSLIEPLLPAPRWGGPVGGRPEAHPRREIVNAIRYLVRSGCAWRALPADFPPWPTVYHHFHRWQADGTTARIRQALRARSARRPGVTRNRPRPCSTRSRAPAPTVPKASRGWDIRQEDIRCV